MVNLSTVRHGIETLYFDRATIIEYQHVFDPEDCSTGVKEVVLCENEPCKVSHDRTSTTRDGDAGDDTMLITKLFIRPDLEVKSGSKIIVTRNGVDVIYKNSGETAMYINHQEIKIELWEDKA